MKTILTVALFGCFSISFGQSADTLIMVKLSDMEWTKSLSNSNQFRCVKFADGSILAIGDKMKLGSPSGTNQSAAQSQGLLGNNINRTNNFTYIMLGRMAAAVLSGITYLPESFKGREVTIENIKIYRSKRKDTPSVASVIFQNPGMDISVLDLKFALEFGEVINPKAAMTSDQALAELKKAKDKLDLGLITQQYFDSLRTALAPFIK
jgi:hypothetical protein